MESKSPTRTPDPAKDNWVFCERSLREVSRTFSRPIAMLQGDLCRAVTCGYLLCRVADTIEDNATLGTEERDLRYEAFLDVLFGKASSASFEALWPNIEGSTEAEISLVTNLHKVMAVFDSLPLSMQRAVLNPRAPITKRTSILCGAAKGEVA